MFLFPYAWKVDRCPKCGFTKKLNDCKSVHYAIHEYNQDNIVHAFSVVLGIGQDITLLRLGLTVIYSEIKTTLYTLSKAHSETGRVTSKLREPTDFRVCPKATAIGKWTNKPRWVTSW